MDVNAYGAALYPSMLRGIRDGLGLQVNLSPAQLTAYLDLGEEAHRLLVQHTIMGLPCLVDPTMEKDVIEIHNGSEVVRIINLAIPSYYAQR